MTIRIVFMGSPDFAVPALEALGQDFTIVGAVTQPDRPAGRGRALMSPPVKTTAVRLGIPTIQPHRLRSDVAAKDQIRRWQPDIIVVAAFGQILQSDVLQIAPNGCLNIHASLLPRWRGVSPIQASILNGDPETGVTIMKMDEGIDTGDIVQQLSIPIEPEDTGGSLFSKLSTMGANLIVQTIPAYLAGQITPRAQGESPTPYAPMLSRADGELDFNTPAETLARKVRAYHPWPGTFMPWQGSPLKIHQASALQMDSPGAGVLCTHHDFPAVGTTQGILLLHELQPAGKKKMPGDQFLRGVKSWDSTG